MVLMALAALALRLYRLDAQDVWWDEARNIDVAARALSTIATSPELDIHPPLYFYLLHGWMRVAGDSAFALRYLSVWFGALLVPLIWALARRLCGRWGAFGSAAVAAFLPFLLGEAQETRMYTVTLVWVVLAAHFLQRAVERNSSHGRVKSTGLRSPALAWAGAAIFSAVALMTHYAAGFALLPLWLWAAGWTLSPCFIGSASGRRASRRAAVMLVVSALGTAILCLPIVPVALRQIPGYRNPNLTVPSFGAYLAELARVYGLGEHIAASAARPWSWLLGGLLLSGLLLALLGAWRSVRGQPAGSWRPVSLAVMWAVIPLLVYFWIIKDRATFATRYIALALPGWLLLAGVAVEGWARRGRWMGVVASVAVVGALLPGLAGDLNDPQYFREDTRGLVAWLRASTDPATDLILVDQRYPFGYYYDRWNNAADGFPPSAPVDETPAQYLFVDINAVADRLTDLCHGKSRVFWVRWFESDTDPRGAVPFLLEKFGALKGEIGFRGFGVAWYEISPDTQFELAEQMSDVDARFGDQVVLRAFALGGSGSGTTATLDETRSGASSADRPVWVVLRWSKLATASHSLKANVVLKDANGLIVSRDDRPIVNDRHLSVPNWSTEDAPLGVYLLKPDPATPPGEYSVELVAYDSDTLERFSVTGAASDGGGLRLGTVMLSRASTPPQALPLAAPTAEFAWGGVRLLGHGTLPADVNPGDTLAFDLYWQAENGQLPDLQVATRLVDVAGAVVLETEHVPVGETYPTSRWAEGEVVRDHVLWRVDPQLEAGTYRVEVALHGRNAESESVTVGSVDVTGRAHVYDLPISMDHVTAIRFGDQAELAGFDLAPASPEPGSELQLTLYWRALGTPEIAYHVSAQLLDAAGTLRAQRDQAPGEGALPTTTWVPGEILADRYLISLGSDLAVGNYSLHITVYDPGTMTRLAAQDSSGGQLGDAPELSVIQVR